MKYFYIIFSLVILISCSENSEDLVKNRKEDAINKFNQFYACYEIAKKTDPITENKINWEKNDCNGEYRSSNVYQIGFDSFKDLSRPLDVWYDGTRRREHADMAQLFDIDLSAHKEEHSFVDDEKYRFHSIKGGDASKYAILHFLDSKYLVINRVLEFIQPISLNQESYEPGRVIGDVLVFDVEKPKLLGGFSFDIENSEKVSFDTHSNVHNALRADLIINIKQYIKTEFMRLTPSITKGFNF